MIYNIWLSQDFLDGTLLLVYVQMYVFNLATKYTINPIITTRQLTFAKDKQFLVL